MADIFGNLMGGGHVAAQAGQRLAEGAHVDIYFIFQAKVAGRAPAAFAQNAKTVGVIHHDTGAVLLGQPYNFRQLGNIAAHAEHTIGDDKAAGIFWHLLQLALQILHIGVVKAQHLAVAQFAAIVDAGMVFLIADDNIAPADNGTDDAQIGLEAGGKGDDGLLVQEFGELRFQLQMHFQRTIEKTGAGAAGAVLLKRFDPGFDDLRAGGKAQIVIGAQHDAAAALHDDLRGLAAFQRVEVGVDAFFLELAGQGRFAAFFKQIDHSSCSSSCSSAERKASSTAAVVSNCCGVKRLQSWPSSRSIRPGASSVLRR